MEYRRQGSNFKTLLRQHYTLHEFHVTNGQNTHDQITSDRQKVQTRVIKLHFVH